MPSVLYSRRRTACLAFLFVPFWAIKTVDVFLFFNAPNKAAASARRLPWALQSPHFLCVSCLSICKCLSPAVIVFMGSPF